MDNNESFIQKVFQHATAWTLAIMGWFVTNPWMRAQLEGDGKGLSLLSALWIAPLMLGVAVVFAIFGSMLSVKLVELYETKIKGGKHFYAWAILACVAAVLLVWFVMNVEVYPGYSFVQ